MKMIDAMHRMADGMQQAGVILCLHIVDPTADRIKSAGVAATHSSGPQYKYPQRGLSSCRHKSFRGTAKRRAGNDAQRNL